MGRCPTGCRDCRIQALEETNHKHEHKGPQCSRGGAGAHPEVCRLYGLDPAKFGTHSQCQTSVVLIYRRADMLRVGHALLGLSTIESEPARCQLGLGQCAKLFAAPPRGTCPPSSTVAKLGMPVFESAVGQSSAIQTNRERQTHGKRPTAARKRRDPHDQTWIVSEL